MITLDTALEIALDGEAILFAGAGFSSDAMNLKGGKFPRGAELASFFNSVTGKTHSDLQIASEVYLEHVGPDVAISELKQIFSTKHPSSASYAIGSIPWKRIYTTNYDNLIENSYTLNNKTSISVTLSDNAYDVGKVGNMIVHLNGFIERLTKDAFASEFKLTNSSYLTNEFINSKWISLFRSDIALARAVFFIGYSLYDLDIKRVLVENPELKNKCIFVVGSSPPDDLTYVVNKFGTVEAVGVDEIGLALSRKQRTYKPKEIDDIPLISFSKLQSSDLKHVKLTDNKVFSLYLYGDYDISLINKSTISSGDRYIVNRHISNNIVSDLDKHVYKNILLHSDLGNGKSIIVQEVKCKLLQKGFDCFELKTVSERSVLELAHIIDNATRRTLIVIENYQNYLRLIEDLSLRRNDNIYLLLTTRSIINDTFYERLKANIKGEVKEYDLNLLKRRELEELNIIFNSCGLWNEKASLSDRTKLNVLENKCNSEFQLILMDIIRSPEIQRRIIGIFDRLDKKHSYHEIIVMALVLELIGVSPTVELIYELTDVEYINSTAFRKDQIVREIIDFDKNTVRVKSPILAKFILNNVDDCTIISELLVRAVTRAEMFCRRNSIHEIVFRQLNVYTNLQNILPEKNRRQAIISYFESIKNLDSNRRNHFFWLQYAIARLFFKDYEKAGTYFQTAYSFAKNLKNFSTHQIDNHFARYLLDRALDEGTPENCMKYMREAHTIISRQIAQNNNMHYPYRVARKYSDFYHKFSTSLRPIDLEFIFLACKYITDKIALIDKKQSNNRYIHECNENLLSILALNPES